MAQMPSFAEDANNMTASYEVSPISSTPSPTGGLPPTSGGFPQKKASSKLPVPKTDTKKFWKLPTGGKASPGLDTANVRWDEYSGEPTAGAKGKPQSATPGSVRLRETPTSPNMKMEFGTSTHISAASMPPRKRVGGRELAEAPIKDRPEWNGPVGRQTIAKPVLDSLIVPGPRASADDAASLSSSPKVSKVINATETTPDSRVEERSSAITHSAPETSVEPAQSRQKDVGRMQRIARDRLEKARRERDRLNSHKALEEPSVSEPLVETNNLPMGRKATDPVFEDVKTSTHAVSAHDDDLRPRQPLTMPRVVEESSPESIKAPFSDHMHAVTRQKSVTSTPTLESDVASPQAKHLLVSDEYNRGRPSGYDHSYEDLGSRFSSTTMATSAYDVSPQPSPAVRSSSPGDQSPRPILNRKRPVAPSSGYLTPTKSHVADAFQSAESGTRRMETKQLPRPPPDAQVVDPIQTLQAKRDVLRRRRQNLESVINDLTNVVQPNSIKYDLASRAEIKNSVSIMEKELSEIVKEEHDTGLKLHRAWKRYDAKAAYEPTSIWIRRVTN